MSYQKEILLKKRDSSLLMFYLYNYDNQHNRDLIGNIKNYGNYRKNNN